MVATAIDRLVTEDWLRIRFARSRIQALADLALRGIELTPDEMELFMQTDSRVWFCETAMSIDRAH
jgi:hypothetical protein